MVRVGVYSETPQCYHTKDGQLLSDRSVFLLTVCIWLISRCTLFCLNLITSQHKTSDVHYRSKPLDPLVTWFLLLLLSFPIVLGGEFNSSHLSSRVDLVLC